MVPYCGRGGNDLVRRWITSMHRSAAPREERGKEEARGGAVSGLGRILELCSRIFWTELVRNSVEIQLLFSAQRRKGNATADRNAMMAIAKVDGGV